MALHSYLIWLVCLGGVQTSAYSLRRCFRHAGKPIRISCVNQPINETRAAVQDLPTNLECLNLSSNHIKILQQGDFASFPKLTLLRLDMNQIEDIQEGALRGLQLQSLNLSENRLTNLPSDFGTSLSKLTLLFLSGNKFSNLSDNLFRPLLRLHLLDISHNPLSSITFVSCLISLRKLVARSIGPQSLESQFSLPANINELSLSYNNISKLGLNTSGTSNKILNLLELQSLLKSTWAPRLLNISLCSMSYNDSEQLQMLCQVLSSRPTCHLKLNKNSFRNVQEAFQNCTKIKSLDLSDNQIEEPKLFQSNQTFLESLKLAHNRIRSMDLCAPSGSACLPNLLNLTFQFNRLYSIGENAFQGLSNLRTLSLAVNQIIYIHTLAFNGLHKLEKLDLSRNAIGELFDSMLYHVNKIKILLVRNNRISVLYKKTFCFLTQLRILDLGGNQIQRIEADTFLGLSKLVNLYLDRNLLKSLSEGIFRGLSSLHILDLASNNLQYSELKLEYPSFVHLTSLRRLRLNHQQPYGIHILPSNLFAGLDHLNDLDISSNKLYSLNTLPFASLSNLTALKMSDMCNGVSLIPNATFASLHKLQKMDLENIGMTEIRSEVFHSLSRSLVKLNLKNNMIQVVTLNLAELFPHLDELDIYYNPLACVCENENFLSWTLTSSTQVPSFYKMKCPTLQPHNSKYLFNFDPSIYFSPTCVVTLIFLFLILTSFVNPRIHLHIFISVTSNFFSSSNIYSYILCLASFVLLLSSRYDAFVSYSSKDEVWVLEQLLPNLEGSSDQADCQLCLHHRDFVPGNPIVSSIVDAIYTSRKTLCVVSSNYLLSEWCSMEVQVALHRLFEEHQDVLVIIFLEPLSPHMLSAYHKLRRIIRKKTYLQWPEDMIGQKLFWTKLKRAIRPQGSNSLDIEGSLVGSHH
uniref:Toll-like receptor 13 n=1 Tax=Erpetoichthys calabaricus TaxID=27687 RepID=A0A8C4SNN8_ERPCA